MTAAVAIRRVATNGIELSVAEAGPADGPLVLLLHGFPETWYGWRHQVEPLAAAGYRVLIPDQRGYGQSDKPPGVSSYALDLLVADVLGLIDASGREQASIVGHDWGGIVAWAAVERFPGRFDAAAIINAPHPAVMQQALRGDWRQIRRSWYTFAFQIPGLPELLLKRHNYRALERALTATSRPGAFEHADFELGRAAWAQPGALRAMLHWYRAAARSRPLPLPDPPIAVPVQLIWGVEDQALGPGLARSSFAQCQNADLAWIEAATHWVVHEQPDRVNQILLSFLRRARPGPAPRRDDAGPQPFPGDELGP